MSKIYGCLDSPSFRATRLDKEFMNMMNFWLFEFLMSPSAILRACSLVVNMDAWFGTLICLWDCLSVATDLVLFEILEQSVYTTRYLCFSSAKLLVFMMLFVVILLCWVTVRVIREFSSTHVCEFVVLRRAMMLGYLFICVSVSLIWGAKK